MPKASDPGPSSVDEQVGHAIAAIRQERGLTQDALALGVGLPLDLLIAYETGAQRIRAAELLDVAEFLGVAPSAFFGWGDGGQLGVALR